MTKIKICGITNIEDANLAIDFGADALGFIFYPKSKRYIEPEEAYKIISKLPPFINIVGVFVNQAADEIKRVKEISGFDTVQIHGDETPDFCKELGCKLIKAIRVKEKIDLAEVESYNVHAVLFDTYSANGYGGTGECFVWETLRDLNISKKVILSGGLNSDNVSEAIRIVNPYAVDVSSGVEDYPGKKNREKLKKFIQAVKYGS